MVSGGSDSLQQPSAGAQRPKGIVYHICIARGMLQIPSLVSGLEVQLHGRAHASHA